MSAFDRQRLFTALILLVMALLVASGAPGIRRWRRQLRGAAIVGFIAAVVVAMAEIALWWTAVAR